jgi:hypothetical protein
MSFRTKSGSVGKIVSQDDGALMGSKRAVRDLEKVVLPAPLPRWG